MDINIPRNKCQYSENGRSVYGISYIFLRWLICKYFATALIPCKLTFSHFVFFNQSYGRTETSDSTETEKTNCQKNRIREQKDKKVFYSAALCIFAKFDFIFMNYERQTCFCKFVPMKQHLLILLFLLACPAHLIAAARTEKQEETLSAPDSIRISLLTCAAGEEIYSLFGHTAIRYENYTRGIDAVFNYGIFNFNAPNFVLRFALGETDYQLGAADYGRFAAEYHYLERDVWQQELNLTPQEKEKLIALLEENYRPENRVYRYNFFYDNCATRPRDLIEKSIDGTLQYAGNMTDTDTGTSFRDLLHKYTEGHPWSRFGMNLCMGSRADKPISRRQMMFVPFNVQTYFDQARIADKEGKERPLVLNEEKIIETGSGEAEQPSEGFTPMHAALLLFILTATATLYGIRRKKTLWGIDLALFLVAGIAGCILALLALFSQHPAVSPNYLLFVFHPLHLFCLPCMLNSVRKRRRSRYMKANLVVLTLFTLLWAVIPQRFPLSVLPLALCLLIRSASNAATAR